MDIETSVIYLSQIVEITNTINWGTFSWIHEPKILPPSLPTPGNIWQEVMVWVATILSLWYYKSQALFIIAWLHCKGKQLLPDTCLQQQKSQICSAPGELLLQKQDKLVTLTQSNSSHLSMISPSAITTHCLL